MIGLGVGNVELLGLFVLTTGFVIGVFALTEDLLLRFLAGFLAFYSCGFIAVGTMQTFEYAVVEGVPSRTRYNPDTIQELVYAVTRYGGEALTELGTVVFFVSGAIMYLFCRYTGLVMYRSMKKTEMN